MASLLRFSRQGIAMARSMSAPRPHRAFGSPCTLQTSRITSRHVQLLPLSAALLADKTASSPPVAVTTRSVGNVPLKYFQSRGGKKESKQDSWDLLLQQNPELLKMGEEQLRMFQTVDSDVRTAFQRLEEWERKAGEYVAGEINVMEGKNVVNDLRNARDLRKAAIGECNKLVFNNIMLEAASWLRMGKFDNCLETCKEAYQLTITSEEVTARLSNHLHNLLKKKPELLDVSRYPTMDVFQHRMLDKVPEGDGEIGRWVEIVREAVDPMSMKWNPVALRISVNKLVGQALQSKSLFEQALDVYMKSVQEMRRVPKDQQVRISIAPILLSMAECYKELKRLDEAEATLTELAGILENDVSADSLGKMAEEFNSNRNVALSETLLALGSVQFAKDDLDEAESTFKRGIALAAKNITLCLDTFCELTGCLSDIHGARNEIRRATGILMAQLRTLASVGKGESEQAARTYDRLARLCLFQNDEKMTLEYTSRAHECWLAAYEAAKKEVEEGSADLEVLHGLRANLGYSFMAKGRLYMQFNHYGEAKERCRRAIPFVEKVFGASSAQLGEIHLMLVECYMKKQQDDLNRMSEQLDQFESENSEEISDLMEELEKQHGDDEESMIAGFEQAIGEMENAPKIQQEDAQAEIDALNSIQKAIKCYEAATTHMNDPRLYQQLAISYRLLGDLLQLSDQAKSLEAYLNALKAHDKRAPEEIEASIDALQEEGKCASCAGELLSLKKDANSALDAFNRAHMCFTKAYDAAPTPGLQSELAGAIYSNLNEKRELLVSMGNDAGANACSRQMDAIDSNVPDEWRF